MSVYQPLGQGQTTQEQALALFDSLEPVSTDFMLGHWKGEGYATGHPLDGLLEAYHWHGKRFLNSEQVHPLVFSRLRGGVAYVNPAFMGPLLGLVDRLPIPKASFFGHLFQLLMPLFATRRARARIRQTEYRGKTSATMIYDHLPINDVFRRIDDHTVLGIMDLKGVADPFFFVLHRTS